MSYCWTFHTIATMALLSGLLPVLWQRLLDLPLAVGNTWSAIDFVLGASIGIYHVRSIWRRWDHFFEYAGPRRHG